MKAGEGTQTALSLGLCADFPDAHSLGGGPAWSHPEPLHPAFPLLGLCVSGPQNEGPTEARCVLRLLQSAWRRALFQAGASPSHTGAPGQRHREVSVSSLVASWRTPLGRIVG